MIRSWPSVPSLLPRGLNLVWGDETSSPDDVIESEETGSDESGSDANDESGLGEYAANANGATKEAEASEAQAEGEAPAAEIPSPKYLIRFTSMNSLDSSRICTYS